ncbi:helix-turn-helix domain-containing protein [Dactylosporangium sp. NPDC051485]|uniref:TetR/AcrR family transcriptional regulator n=1 Tax=Dactylosporangium sp. NPDC051485 TaxID=3154846 RepID=UPI0034338C6A
MNEQHAARVVRGRNRIHTGDSDAENVRAHIQRVALDLFIEEGYDKTSLREIAEKLGVTKAALYYHFPTKDDIVASLIEQRIKAVDALLDWANTQPRDSATRLKFIQRYSVLHDEFVHGNVIRFFERNQTLVNTLPAGIRLREQMGRIFDFLSDPEESLAQQLRRTMAIFSVHASWFLLRERPGTLQERREAALEVAAELLRAADAHSEVEAGEDRQGGKLDASADLLGEDGLGEDGQGQPQAEQLDAGHR